MSRGLHCAKLALLLSVSPVLGQADTPALTSVLILDANTLDDAKPWGVAVLPEGEVLFTDKCKGLYAVPLDSAQGEEEPSYLEPVLLFGAQGAAVVADDLICEDQSGANGVALDPDFAENRWVYMFMTSNQDEAGTGRAWNHVVRVTLADDLTSVSERTDIVTDILFKNAENAHGPRGGHSGGRIRFGPDDLLYITTGDNHNETVPQDLQALGGKVLRVNRDGSAAEGNNTPEGGDPRIYAYGFRNVQGIAFEPETGQAYIAEHGPEYMDEVTPLVPGGNGGWDPANRPGLTCPDDYCGYAGNLTTMPMTDLERFPDAMKPTWTYNGALRGMGSAEFLSGEQWSDWEGDLLIGEMAAYELYRLTLEDGNVTSAEVVSGTDAMPALPKGRYRSLTQGPEGDLYAVVDQNYDSTDAKIWRIMPPRLPAGAPSAAPLSGNDTSGDGTANIETGDGSGGDTDDGQSALCVHSVLSLVAASLLCTALF